MKWFTIRLLVLFALVCSMTRPLSAHSVPFPVPERAIESPNNAPLAEFTLDELSNLAYQSEIVPSGKALLKNGLYTETVSGLQVSLSLLPDVMDVGSLNEQESAAVILVEEDGGKSKLFKVAVVIHEQKQAKHLASIDLGDRMRINSVQISDNQILVDLLTHDADDESCCPTLPTKRYYEVQGTELALVNEVVESPNLPSSMPDTLHLAGCESEALTADRLANIGYQSSMASGGMAYLSNGTYTETLLVDDPNAVTTVRLLPEPTACGFLFGLDAAAVLLIEDGGGSGRFVHLAVVIDAKGWAMNIGSILLGDRVQVHGLMIEHDKLLVDLTTHGPEDALCCPTQRITQIYQVGLGLVNQTPPSTFALTADSLTIDTQGIFDSYQAYVIATRPYDNSMPPGTQGRPAHLEITFNGTTTEQLLTVDATGWLAIYPIDDFKALWEEAGDPYVNDTLTQLQTMLSEQPPTPQAPLPTLPEISASNDLAVQVAYLELSDGGTGMRFVGRYSQDASPIVNAQLAYQFQGLSKDGKYLIVATIPVKSKVLPNTYNDVDAATIDAVTNDWAGYQAKTADKLAAEKPEAFTPSLTELDALMRSLTISEPVSAASPGAAANPATEESASTTNGAIGTTWVWSQTSYSDGSTVTAALPDAFTLQFAANQQVTLTTDCNKGAGDYTLTGNQLALNVAATTRKGCKESQENLYLADLNQAQSISLTESSLQITLADNKGVMEFAAQQ